jgi:hypothetical protein
MARFMAEGDDSTTVPVVTLSFQSCTSVGGPRPRGAVGFREHARSEDECDR